MSTIPCQFGECHGVLCRYNQAAISRQELRNWRTLSIFPSCISSMQVGRNPSNFTSLWRCCKSSVRHTHLTSKPYNKWNNRFGYVIVGIQFYFPWEAQQSRRNSYNTTQWSLWTFCVELRHVLSDDESRKQIQYSRVAQGIFSMLKVVNEIPLPRPESRTPRATAIVRGVAIRDIE
jgi:hypothetical protein